MSAGLDKIQKEVNIFDSPGEFIVRDAFRLGFEAAHTLEVLALHPEVRKLLAALKEIRSYSLGSKADICDNALSPWTDALKTTEGE